METMTTQQQYTCPMHPEVLTVEAGKCPKCGMNLVPVKELKRTSSESHLTHQHSARASANKTK